MKLFNANTQQVEEADTVVDHNNEVVCTFTDGTVVKFPAGLTKEEFDRLVEAHQTANEGKEIITPEMEAEQSKLRSASLELIEDKTNVTSAPEPTSDNSQEEA